MTSSLGARVLVVLSLLGGRAAGAPASGDSADPTAAARDERAARAFEQGVALFRRAEYRAAAAAFLEADEIAASDDALVNAIAAARRANDHLLVVRASQRALRRESASAELATSAREALSQAERQLSRIELACVSEAPCALALDGVTVTPGTLHVLPGIHTVSARGAPGEHAEQRLETAAGATYSIALEPRDPRPAAQAPAQPRGLHAPIGRQEVRPAEVSRPLSPAVFWVAAGVSAGLAAVTTWSGIDTLAARDELPDPPTSEQIAGVEQRIVRTDVLLIATGVLAAATTYAGIALVDWRPASRAAARPLVLAF